MFKKKVLPCVLLALCVPGLAFSQGVTFFNRLGTTFLVKEAKAGSDCAFSNVYNWVVGGYEGERVSFYGRIRFALESDDGWKHSVAFRVMDINKQKGTKYLEFSGAVRPWSFLELAVGNGYGTNDRMTLPWKGYQLPGGYGYATELSHGLRKWASGNGVTLLFKGTEVGLEGFSLGFNALPLDTLRSGGAGAWKPTVAINYSIDDIANLSFGGRFNIAQEGGQTLGLYGELLAVRNLKANAGVTMYTNSTSTVLGSNDAMATYSKSFAAVVNAGVQYTISPIRMTLAVDGSVLAGSKTLTGQYGRHDSTSTPMMVGGMIRWVVFPALTTIIQVKYGDNLAGKEAARESKWTITPRLLCNAGKVGTFCLTPVVTFSRKNGESHVGYNFSVYWQRNFGGGSPGRPRG